jgi:hypothetical protein
MTHILQLIGLVANLVGTIIATLSGGLYLKLVDASITALEMSVQAWIGQHQIVPVITGLDIHRGKLLRRRMGIVTGLFLIVAGFLFQLVAALTGT